MNRSTVLKGVPAIVSDSGEVKMLDGTPYKKYIKNGYEAIVVNKSYFYVHKIVAEAFCDKRPGCQIVDHINGDKLDNNYKNLEWVTHRENSLRAGSAGKLSAPKHKRPIYVIKRYESQQAAAKDLGINDASINKVLRGNRPSVHGYKFIYASVFEYVLGLINGKKDRGMAI